MPLLTVANKMFTPLGGGPLPGSIGLPATSASQMAALGISTNGVYYFKPTGAPTAFQAYVDFTTPNGPWVSVGNAQGGAIGLWSLPSTWYSRTTDSGSFTDPTTTTSSFNAGSFIYVKGSRIMIKEGGGNSGSGGSVGYVQATGWSATTESFRDVYASIVNPSSWPSQPSYARQLTISTRSAGIGSTDLLYGTSWNDTGSSAYWYVYAFDVGGDTYAMLSTAKNSLNDAGAYTEADIGFGSNENGPVEAGTSPANSLQTGGASFDAGCNGAYAQGWNGTPFSIWINN